MPLKKEPQPGLRLGRPNLKANCVLKQLERQLKS